MAKTENQRQEECTNCLQSSIMREEDVTRRRPPPDLPENTSKHGWPSWTSITREEDENHEVVMETSLKTKENYLLPSNLTSATGNQAAAYRKMKRTTETERQRGRDRRWWTREGRGKTEEATTVQPALAAAAVDWPERERKRRWENERDEEMEGVRRVLRKGGGIRLRLVRWIKGGFDYLQPKLVTVYSF